MKPKMRVIISPGRKQLSTTSNRDISQHAPRSTATMSVQGWKWGTRCWRLITCGRWRFRDNSSSSYIWRWRKRMWMQWYSLRPRLRHRDWIRDRSASGRTSIRRGLCCCGRVVRRILPVCRLFPFLAALPTQDCPSASKPWPVFRASPSCSASPKPLSVLSLNPAGRRLSAPSSQRYFASSLPSYRLRTPTLPSTSRLRHPPRNAFARKLSNRTRTKPTAAVENPAENEQKNKVSKVCKFHEFVQSGVRKALKPQRGIHPRQPFIKRDQLGVLPSGRHQVNKFSQFLKTKQKKQMWIPMPP